MNLLQNALKLFYPLRMGFSKATGLGMESKENPEHMPPPISFYSLEAVTNKGNKLCFEQYRGKYVLLVNLASFCGFTGQYADLQQLYTDHAEKLVVLGFPSNDFGGQEPGTDDTISRFCTENYGVSFPLFKKDHVTGSQRQPVYQWLSDPQLNGWNSQAPEWNFCKYQVDPQGVLLHYFSSAVDPMDEKIVGRLFIR